MTREMILISILSIVLAMMGTSHQAHRMKHTYLNSSDLQDYATNLKILMIGILFFF